MELLNSSLLQGAESSKYTASARYVSSTAGGGISIYKYKVVISVSLFDRS